MAQTDVSGQVQVLQTGTLLTLKGGMWKRGEAVLTNERFFRKVRGTALLPYLFGALGALINTAFPVKNDIDIPLTSITVIGRGKMGLKKDVLYIQTADGKSYQLTPNSDFWINGLKQALESQGATLTQNADERWTVSR